MGTKEKLKSKLRGKLTPKDIKWSELRSLLISLGFEEKQCSGSRVRFYKPETDSAPRRMIRLHRPHPEPICGPKLVQNVANSLIEWDLI